MAEGPAHHAVQSTTRVPGEREPPRAERRPGRSGTSRPGDSTLVLAGGGRRREGPGRNARDAVGNAGLDEPSRGRRDEDVPISELLEPEHAGGVEHGSRREAEQRGLLENGRSRPLRGVAVHGMEELLAAGEPLGDLGQLVVLREVRPPHHDEKVLELLCAIRGDHEVAVARRLNRWHLDRAPRSSRRGPTQERREDGGVRDHRHRHAVEDGHVDVLAVARAAGFPVGGERGDGSEGPRRPFADAPSGGQRWSLRESALAGRPARRLERELGPGPARPWPQAAERCDGHDHGGLVRTAPAVHIGGVAQDDVRLRSEPVALRDRPLGGVEELEERPGTLETQWICSVGFHLDDIGTGVGEELRAVGAGDAVRVVEDAEILEGVSLRLRTGGCAHGCATCNPPRSRTRVSSVGKHECDGVTQRAGGHRGWRSGPRTRRATSCREPSPAHGRSGQPRRAAGPSGGPGTRRSSRASSRARTSRANGSSDISSLPMRRASWGRRSKARTERRSASSTRRAGVLPTSGRVVTLAPSDEAHWTSASPKSCSLEGK